MDYILDTNIVSAVVNQNPKILAKLQEVELNEEEVFISCITYYEAKRGLLAVNATRKMSIFSAFCASVEILFLDDMAIIETASRIHADLKQRGRPIQDADILIASTAIARGLILVSNDSDMQRVPGVTLENWLDK
ncbi:type II toxin-antitoxin system VapC family toxin [[Phormidium] sp. ETS-05]|uniref:type II toxin-antitoxin system VapC family toxin n=1 Tax=[Phormidium] sp. ETS-05 TaxID=222819 RepID=UPI0018EF2555|nr:type II toxin-antitoxin system VapC family toxin [[Phormidium] sp. ETS-05]